MTKRASLSTFAIVCRTQHYKEGTRLLTLYTEKRGKLTALCKKPYLYLSPPIGIEAELYETPSLWLVREAHPFYHPNVSSSLSSLKACSILLKAIDRTQLPHSPAPSLFALLKAYLTRLPDFQDPEACALSFLLKLFHHEGMHDLAEYDAALIQPLLHVTSFSQLFPLVLTPPQKGLLEKLLTSL